MLAKNLQEKFYYCSRQTTYSSELHLIVLTECVTMDIGIETDPGGSARKFSAKGLLI